MYSYGVPLRQRNKNYYLVLSLLEHLCMRIIVNRELFLKSDWSRIELKTVQLRCDYNHFLTTCRNFNVFECYSVLFIFFLEQQQLYLKVFEC